LGKVNQELFGLINYGELRKRLGRSVLDKNVILKLHELIYEGTTQIKVKGKTVRVKTPPCRALRKLGQIDKGIFGKIILILGYMSILHFSGRCS